MHPSKTVRLPIPEDACELARWLISGDLVDADDVLEFMRGDVVCLRGTAQAFALRCVVERDRGMIRHERWTPPAERGYPSAQTGYSDFQEGAATHVAPHPGKLTSAAPARPGPASGD